MNISAYGRWTVTTEGDVEGRTTKQLGTVEGRTTKQLGTYEGYLDEIAFALAHQCKNSLKFSLQSPLLRSSSEVNATFQVSVSLDSTIMDSSDPVVFMQDLLLDRNVTVTKGSSYKSVNLINRNHPEVRAKEELEIRKRKALSKLTTEEQKLLGLLDEA